MAKLSLGLGIFSLFASGILTASSRQRIAADLAPAAYDPQSVQEAWSNHLEAFVEQDLGRIMQDYLGKSVVMVYNTATGDYDKYKGKRAIKGMFQVLFAKITSSENLAVQRLSIHNGTGQWSSNSCSSCSSLGHPGMVFLVWNDVTDGIFNATDSFIFDSRFKIVRQNIVLYSPPPASSGVASQIVEEELTMEEPHAEESQDDECTDADKKVSRKEVRRAWNNHFSAFAGSDVSKILKDYDNESVVQIFDALGYREYKGLAEVEELFTSLFTKIDPTRAVAPVVNVDPRKSQVFLVWHEVEGNIPYATDTFVFDSCSKIRFQNIVVFPEH